MSVLSTLCRFPIFNWAFSLPSLPSLGFPPPIPFFVIEIDLSCPLD